MEKSINIPGLSDIEKARLKAYSIYLSNLCLEKDLSKYSIKCEIKVKNNILTLNPENLDKIELKLLELLEPVIAIYTSYVQLINHNLSLDTLKVEYDLKEDWYCISISDMFYLYYSL